MEKIEKQEIVNEINVKIQTESMEIKQKIENGQQTEEVKAEIIKPKVFEQRGKEESQ